LTTADVVVLLFGGRRLPRALRDLATVTIDDVIAHRRVIVVGSDADLAAVLTRLLQAERLDVEVGHVRRPWAARRARAGEAQRVPLIRDETGPSSSAPHTGCLPPKTPAPSTVKPLPTTPCCSTAR